MENKWLEPVVDAYREYFGDAAETIFDIGSRDGDDAEYLRRKLGVDAENVYTFEPNPRSIPIIEGNYPDFNLIKKAVSDFNGEAEFLQIIGEKDLEGSSTLDLGRTREEWVNETSVVTVPVNRFETIMHEESLDGVPLSVVKIDVETYTYEALEGMAHHIYDVKVFHLETEREYPREGHRDNTEVAAFMRAHGFFLYDVTYEWPPNIQDQTWINLRLANKAPVVPETSEY